jgi:hypothetical protein
MFILQFQKNMQLLQFEMNSKWGGIEERKIQLAIECRLTVCEGLRNSKGYKDFDKPWQTRDNPDYTGKRLPGGIAINADSMCQLKADADLLIRFPRPVWADLNCYFQIEAPEKIKQLVGSKPTEMAVHQMRYFRLFDPEQISNFTLFKLPVF